MPPGIIVKRRIRNPIPVYLIQFPVHRALQAVESGRYTALPLRCAHHARRLDCRDANPLSRRQAGLLAGKKLRGRLPVHLHPDASQPFRLKDLRQFGSIVPMDMVANKMLHILCAFLRIHSPYRPALADASALSNPLSTHRRFAAPRLSASPVDDWGAFRLPS